MVFQIAGVVLLACFYGAYFLKMLRQRKAGIRTDQLGAGKTGSARRIELGVKAASYAVPVAEIASLAMNVTALPLPIRVAGLLTTVAGLAFFLASVVTLGESWRAGVSEHDRTSLVTKGVYRISRNPAFLGFDLVYVGFVLMFCNLSLGIISAVAIVMFHLQIVCVEERYLLKSFGDDYRGYRGEVCRYLGNSSMNTGDLVAVALLVACSVSGLMSWGTQDAFAVTNQYGQSVMLWGHGLYARDSVLKAAGFIGSDLIVLTVLVPLFFRALFRRRKASGNIGNLKLAALYAASLYYAASLSFGATYNRMFLAYIALFGLSFFRLLFLSVGLRFSAMRAGRGLEAFLVLLGVALCAAWLPDILTAMAQGGTLSTIEVYTTEVTYVLDIGIMCPMCFLGLWLVREQRPAGAVFVSSLLAICLLEGLMVISQSVFQHLAGVVIPIPQLVTKVLIFAVLCAFSIVLQKRWYAGLR